MKQLISTLLALVMVLGLCACDNKTEYNTSESMVTEDTKPTEIDILPEINMVINNKKDNNITDLRVFPANRSWDNWDAYAHYYIKSDNKNETIRIKLESQWGRNEKTEGDFEVKSDELIEVETNQWQTFRFSVSASSLYFYRVTIYYGEREDILATKTIYTPYEKAFYDETSFTDTPPKFHSLSKLSEKEQIFFDNCQFAVVDYAKTNHYSQVNSITGWQAKKYLYLVVEYKGAGGFESIWFAINNDAPESYVAHFNPSGIIPESEGTPEQNVLKDYFYVEKALTEAISQ